MRKIRQVLEYRYILVVISKMQNTSTFLMKKEIFCRKSEKIRLRCKADIRMHLTNPNMKTK
jgi:hypothetical protein